MSKTNIYIARNILFIFITCLVPSATAWKRTDRNVENQQPPQAQCVNTYNSTNAWLCPVALGAARLSSLSPVSPVGLRTPLAPRGLERPKQCCSKGVLLTVHTYILPQLHIHVCSLSCYSASLPLPILWTHPQAITTGRVLCLLSKGSAYLVVKLKSLRCIYENNKHVNRISTWRIICSQNGSSALCFAAISQNLLKASVSEILYMGG